MNKKFSRVLKTYFCVFTTALVSFGGINFANAYDVYDERNTEISQNFSNEFLVKDSRELSLALNKARENDKIILKNNIYLTNNLNITSSIHLNLNGYKIFVGSDDERIDIGKKTFSHTEKYSITHPGCYTWQDKIKRVYHPKKIFVDSNNVLKEVEVPPTEKITKERVWHPERVEVKYRDIYNYNDSIDVIITNGSIKRMDGRNGKDGICDSWDNFNGKNGESPMAPINVISGTVRFDNVRVKGGNGGNGGNASYQSLYHIPFGGGDGGNGGKGGNGGASIVRERDKCKIYYDSSCEFISGKAGKGGKGSKANPNWWIYRGWNGSNGEDGEDGEDGKYFKKLFELF